LLPTSGRLRQRAAGQRQRPPPPPEPVRQFAPRGASRASCCSTPARVPPRAQSTFSRWVTLTFRWAVS